MFKMPCQLWELKQYLTEEERSTVVKASILNPFKYFCPNGKQEEVIRVFANSTLTSNLPTILFSAANGLGKTYLTLNIIKNVVHGVQNGWFYYPMFRTWKYSKIIWYVSTHNALSTVFLPLFVKMFDSSEYKTKTEGNKIARIEFTNGFVLCLMTYDQSPDQFESTTVGLIIADEPAPQNIWNKFVARTRLGGIIFAPMTPLDVEPYVQDEIVANAGNGMYFQITGSIYDNCHRRGVRGILPYKNVEDIVKKYPPDELRSRAYGEFAFFAERIYQDVEKIFFPAEQFPIDPATDMIFQINDPADGRPNAIAYMAARQVGSDIRKIFFQELPTDKSVPFWNMKGKFAYSVEVKTWLEFERNMFPEELNMERVFDKRFTWQQKAGRTVAEAYEEEFDKLGKASNIIKSYDAPSGEGEIAYGHGICTNMMNHILEDGLPEVIVLSTCYHLMNALRHYIRQRPTTKADSMKAAGTTNIVPKYKDFADVFRYGCCHPVYFDAYVQPGEKREHVSEYNIHGNKYTNNPLTALR